MNNGGPAFPTDLHGDKCYGMSLRDYFAAKALQGMLSQLKADSEDEPYPIDARLCYLLADAMLGARKAMTEPQKS